MPGDEFTTPQPEGQRSTNRDRVPPKKRTSARTKPPSSNVTVATQEPAPVLRSLIEQKWAAGATLTRDDLGSGRGYLVEWELFVDQLFQQLEAVGGSVPLTFVHQQAVVAAVWTINHSLSTKPSVVLVDGSGQQLLAEVQYPNDQTAVVIHGNPYSGTAYLRA